MKLGMIITQTDPETVFNALRLHFTALSKKTRCISFFQAKEWISTKSKIRNLM